MDEFVATTPGGHHAQTSRWARVKRVLGWDAARLIVREAVSRRTSGTHSHDRVEIGGLGWAGPSRSNITISNRTIWDNGQAFAGFPGVERENRRRNRRRL